MPSQTLIDKIWNTHQIRTVDEDQALLHIDRVVLHDRSGPRSLRQLDEAKRSVANASLVLGTMDHVIDTHTGRGDATLAPGGTEFIQLFRRYAKSSGISVLDIGDPAQGIAHVVSPELGFALPGTTLVCGDSHTCTIGGLGALAWGVGVTETSHALATQTLVRAFPRKMRVTFDGVRGPGVTAKDLALALIAHFGASGGANHVIEFAGEAVRALTVEERLTLCNMAVEFGAWTGIVAPDDTTFQWLHGRRFSPRDDRWDRAVAHWRTLHSDAEARWDAALSLDLRHVAPQVTWGTSPGQGSGIDGCVPDPATAADHATRASMVAAMQYMDLEPGQPLAGLPIDAAFIGSCTNARLSDLRAAARILAGRKVASGVKAIVVPGSSAVRRDAESEGLDKIFMEAGFEWRESGCSLCFYAGGDSFGDARRTITSTNRNFEGRQGPGVRSHLASPITVAASAIAGRIADPRPLLR